MLVGQRKEIGHQQVFSREIGHAGGQALEWLWSQVGHKHLPKAQLVQILGFVSPAGPGNENTRLTSYIELVEISP